MRLLRFSLCLLLLTGAGAALAVGTTTVTRSLQPISIDSKDSKGSKNYNVFLYVVENPPVAVPSRFILAMDQTRGGNYLWFAGLQGLDREKRCGVWPLDDSDGTYERLTEDLSGFSWLKKVNWANPAFRDLKGKIAHALTWELKPGTDASTAHFSNRADVLAGYFPACNKTDWGSFGNGPRTDSAPTPTPTAVSPPNSSPGNQFTDGSGSSRGGGEGFAQTLSNPAPTPGLKCLPLARFYNQQTLVPFLYPGDSSSVGVPASANFLEKLMPATERASDCPPYKLQSGCPKDHCQKDLECSLPEWLRRLKIPASEWNFVLGFFLGTMLSIALGGAFVWFWLRHRQSENSGATRAHSELSAMLQSEIGTLSERMSTLGTAITQLADAPKPTASASDARIGAANEPIPAWFSVGLGGQTEAIINAINSLRDLCLDPRGAREIGPRDSALSATITREIGALRNQVFTLNTAINQLANGPKLTASELDAAIGSGSEALRNWLSERFSEIGKQVSESTGLAAVVAPLAYTLGQAQLQAKTSTRTIWDHRKGFHKVFDELRELLNDHQEFRDMVANHQRSLRDLINGLSESYEKTRNVSVEKATKESLNDLLAHAESLSKTVTGICVAFVSVGEASVAALRQTVEALAGAASAVARAEADTAPLRQDQKSLQDRLGCLLDELSKSQKVVAELEAAKKQLGDRLTGMTAGAVSDLEYAGYLGGKDSSGGVALSSEDLDKALERCRQDAESRPYLQVYVRTLIGLRRYLTKDEVRELPHYAAAGLPEILKILEDKSFGKLYGSTNTNEALLGQWEEFLQHIFRAALLLDSYWNDPRESELRGQLKDCCEKAGIVMRRYAEVRPHELKLPVDEEWIEQRKTWVELTRIRGVTEALESDVGFRRQVWNQSLDRVLYCDVAVWGYDLLDRTGQTARVGQKSGLVAKEPGSVWRPLEPAWETQVRGVPLV